MFTYNVCKAHQNAFIVTREKTWWNISSVGWCTCCTARATNCEKCSGTGCVNTHPRVQIPFATELKKVFCLEIIKICWNLSRLLEREGWGGWVWGQSLGPGPSLFVGRGGGLFLTSFYMAVLSKWNVPTTVTCSVTRVQVSMSWLLPGVCRLNTRSSF